MSAKEDTHVVGDFFFFWRGWPGQWFRSYFKDDNGIQYSHAEQYMMAEKARLFKDEETLKLIMKAQRPSEQKDLGREVKNYNDGIWKAHREQVVYQGNIYKFSQDRNLLGLLLATKKKILVEASPIDKIWGIGLAWDDERATIPENWPGLNLLGKALMKVRDTLSKE